MKEVRELLRMLGGEGRTVFLSSHLLSEVQQICDRVAILSHGRCVASGPVEQVLAQGRAAALLVRLGELEEGLAALRAAGIPAALDGDSIRVSLPANRAAEITKVLADRQLYVTELRPEQVSLESVFLELTGEGQRTEG